MRSTCTQPSSSYLFGFIVNIFSQFTMTESRHLPLFPGLKHIQSTLLAGTLLQIPHRSPHPELKFGEGEEREGREREEREGDPTKFGEKLTPPLEST